MQPTLIPTPAGHAIYSHIFIPHTKAKASIILAPAIGIAQKYYFPLADWLCEHGYQVLTFDYYGQGQSLEGRLRDVRSSVKDWAGNDCASVLSHARSLLPEQPIYWIGHSLGGQIVPFIDGNEHISKLITVACGSGYWKDNAKHTHARALLLWKVLMPVLTALYGYFPGKKLNLIGDLPKRAALEWRRWCLTPRYAAGFSAEHQALYSRFTQPIVGLAFSDDEMISKANVHTLHASFDQAAVDLQFIEPLDVGAKRIGHLGFFRPEHKEGAWQRLLPALSS